jgi:hypothetical protein
VAPFTKKEWFKKNQWFADNERLELSSMNVSALVRFGGTEAEVTVYRTFKEGTSITRDTLFVYESGEWKHRFTEEEKNIYMPDASYEEFLKAQQGDTLGKGSATDEVSSVNAPSGSNYETPEMGASMVSVSGPLGMVAECRITSLAITYALRCWLRARYPTNSARRVQRHSQTQLLPLVVWVDRSDR